jgi:hypothetical protein
MDASMMVYANVFFIVSSIAAVVFILGLCTLLFFVVPLARDARDVVAKIKAASKEVEKDFKKIEKAIKS